MSTLALIQSICFRYWLAVPLDIFVDSVRRESGRIEPHQIISLQKFIISQCPLYLGKDLFSNSQEIENTFEGQRRAENRLIILSLELPEESCSPARNSGATVLSQCGWEQSS
jgi:hypothetical protein